MIKYKSKHITIFQNNNDFEINIDNGDYSLKESDILKVSGRENYNLKTFRIGEIYTKDNGSMDATLVTKEYHFNKSDVENFEINPLPNKVQLVIRLKNEAIELVGINNDEKDDENITKIALIILEGKL